jgi:hypothetical protein
MLLLCTFSGLGVAPEAARRGHCARGAYGATGFTQQGIPPPPGAEPEN